MRRKTGKILGISIDLETKKTILEEVKKGLKKPLVFSRRLSEKPSKPLVIVTPNPEQIVLAYEEPWFARLLNEADVALPDGIGVTFAWRMLKIKDQSVSRRTKIKDTIQRIPGVEFMEDLVEIAFKQRVRIGLIGGEGKVAVKAFECLQLRYPGISGLAIEAPALEIIVPKTKSDSLNTESRMLNRESRRTNAELKIGDTAEHKYFGKVYGIGDIHEKEFSLHNSCFSIHSSVFNEYIDKLAKLIRAARIQMVFVALGAPKQELFIEALSFYLSAVSSQSLAKLKAEIVPSMAPTVLMSVGGAFDMIAGKTRRAPKFIRTIGFEWLYRFILEPWRWRRQLTLLKFIYLCIKY